MARKPKPILPAPGQAFLMPLADGRFGVCRVLRQGDSCVLAAASPWIGSKPPAVEEPALREILILTHHVWKKNPELLWIDGPVPPSFASMGIIEPSGEEATLACYSYGSWEGFAMQVLLQWRWDNDRASVLREDKEEARAQVLERRQAEQKRREQLAAATLPKLLKKRRFSSWSGHVSVKPLRATRQLFRDTIQALIDLGSEPRTRDSLRILRSCIQSLNALDEQHEFIDTIEREDLCEEFEEIAHAAGFGQDSVADRWRDW